MVRNISKFSARAASQLQRCQRTVMVAWALCVVLIDAAIEFCRRMQEGKRVSVEHCILLTRTSGQYKNAGRKAASCATARDPKVRSGSGSRALLVAHTALLRGDLRASSHRN